MADETPAPVASDTHDIFPADAATAAAVAGEPIASLGEVVAPTDAEKIAELDLISKKLSEVIVERDAEIASMRSSIDVLTGKLAACMLVATGKMTPAEVESKGPDLFKDDTVQAVVALRLRHDADKNAAVPASPLVSELSSQLVASEQAASALPVIALAVKKHAAYAESLEGALFRCTSDGSVKDALARRAGIASPDGYRDARRRLIASPASPAVLAEFAASMV